MTQFYDDPASIVIDMAELALRPDGAPDDATLGDQPWRIDDEDTAAWALTKIRKARQTARRRNAAAVALIAEHQAAIDELTANVIVPNDRDADRTVEFFTAALTDWHRRQWLADDDPKHRTTNSIRLAGGILTSRAGRDRVEVDDEAALAEIADAEGLDFAAYVPKADKVKLMRWIRQTGEVPRGARLVRATDDDRTWKVEL